ncbi:SDR family NAD(P)-dependent oxidoreductase [Blastococcus litoris]|uniref:SDR family NAD(P)-dependent oxidoreductase n=1 Tax=Blastococcus litoris TaxID=2171622 RepID=UPI000E3039E6|nr:SDR family NAD(P)-dependent oxidoreductase [Blastococcus litoris]
MTTDGRRTALVTGGASGLGLATAGALAAQGLHVVLLARDAGRGEVARDRLRAAHEVPVELVVGDLSDTAGVRASAAAVLAACPRLDVLVHNAGTWPDRRRLNADGVEQAFAVNHLAPFLLNALLEELLAESGARVVQVSAGLYVKGRAEPGATATGERFSSLRTYADTKLCNLAMTPLWARRWQPRRVAIDAVHPGVLRTALGDRGGPVGLLLRLAKRSWEAPEVGAARVARLATAPELAGVTGRYVELETEVPLAPPADDAALAAALWDEAARLTGAPL